MTGDELIRHRLKQLEDWRVESAATVHSTERDVDLLKLESATVKALLVEHRTETRAALESISASMARFHERLDSITTAEAQQQGREQGAKEATIRTGKIIVATLTVSIAFAGLVVALLTLVIK